MTAHEILALFWIVITWLGFLYAGYFIGYRRGFRDGRSDSEDPN